MEKCTLFFFTAEFPFSTGETFIENEIEYLSNAFDKTFIIPFHKSGIARDLPENVKIGNLSNNNNFNIFDSILIIKIIIYEFIKMKKKLFFLKNVRTWFSLLKNAIILSKNLENIICLNSPNQKTILYSYWMNEWALALSILKDTGKVNSFVFRCGGYDIWDERHDGNYLPFRYYIYKNTKGIYPNSKMGQDYLKKFNHYQDKISCLYWGTKDKGMNPFDKNQIPTIVSCSSLIPLKRVHKIIAILKLIDFPIKWVHFGDGVLKDELLVDINTLPNNVLVELKGNVRNNIILDFYSNNSVTCFINVSSTESMPVSIQEAISFGIPVIATNVGGVKEIVTEQTGFLMDMDFDEKKVVEEIKKMICQKFTEEGYRKQIRTFWLEHFSAEKNYPAFVEILKL